MTTFSSPMPVLTWDYVVDSTIHVQTAVVDNLGNDIYNTIYTIPSGSYHSINPNADIPSDFGIIFNGSSSTPDTNNSIASAFAKIIARFVNGANTNFSLPNTTSVTCTLLKTENNTLFPCEIEYKINDLNSFYENNNYKFLFRFSLDPAIFSSPNPNTALINNDITTVTNFWSAIGYAPVVAVSGNEKIRTIVMEPTTGLIASSIASELIGTAIPYVILNVPIANTWCPDRDVYDDYRMQVATVGVSKSRINNSSEITKWGERVQTATEWEYVVAARIYKHKRDDKNYWSPFSANLLNNTWFDFNIISRITIWEDVHDAVLNNQELTLIINAQEAIGSPYRLVGKWMDIDSLSSWDATISDSAATGRLYDVVLMMELNN